MITLSSQKQYLWFLRDGIRYAAPMDYLLQVLPSPVLRPLPASEPALAGLMTLRDAILPVLDPWSLVSSGEAPTVTSPVVVVLGFPGRPILGLLVESVGKVVELPTLDSLTFTPRIPSAFMGECHTSTGLPVRVFDMQSLAETMGLAAMPLVPSVSNPLA